MAGCGNAEAPDSVATTIPRSDTGEHSLEEERFSHTPLRSLGVAHGQFGGATLGRQALVLFVALVGGFVAGAAIASPFDIDVGAGHAILHIVVAVSSGAAVVWLLRHGTRDLDLTETAVREWVRQADVDAGRRDGLTTAEREELARLRRENRVLREERDILKRATAFFARETR